MTWRTSFLLLAVVGATPALGADCLPLDETEFRSYVLDAQAAIDRGDIELPAEILSEIDARIACLQFAPAPRMWADLLMARAIVEFSRDGPWEVALSAALRIRPAIDRGVGPGHPLSRWVAGAPSAWGPPIPDGVRLYVDGFPAPAVPPSDGLFLVQKTDGRYWNSLLLHNAAVPDSFVSEPVVQPSRIRSWGRIGVQAGPGIAEQSRTWPSDVYVANDKQPFRIGAAGDLQLTFLSPFGLLGRGSMTYGSAFWLDWSLTAITTTDRLTIGPGVGSMSVSVFESDFSRDEVAERVQALRYPQLTLLTRSQRKPQWDFHFSGGASPAVVRLEMGAGLLLPQVSDERYRIALGLDARQAAFVQLGFGDREVLTRAGYVVIRLDWVRGEY